MQSLLTVIVPIYNSEEHLSKCIESIINQSYKDIEILLINDGSTDRSLEICEKFASEDDRIKIVNKKNEGVSKTRNLGLNLAKGQYISFIDSDDYISESMYNNLVYRLRKDNSSAVCMLPYVIKTNYYKKNTRNHVLKSHDALKLLMKLEFPSSLWAYLYKKDAIGKMRLNEKVHYFEDFEFNYNFLRTQEKISISNERNYFYSVKENSVNNLPLNEKKMSCLDIYGNIENNIRQDKLLEESLFFQSHFLISMILNLAKADTTDEKYSTHINIQSKKLIKKLSICTKVPLIYKTIILFSSLNTKITANVIKSLKYN